MSGFTMEEKRRYLVACAEKRLSRALMQAERDGIERAVQEAEAGKIDASLALGEILGDGINNDWAYPTRRSALEQYDLPGSLAVAGHSTTEGAAA